MALCSGCFNEVVAETGDRCKWCRVADQEPIGTVTIDSVALRRLIDEVGGVDERPSGYNRTYSRHNR